VLYSPRRTPEYNGSIEAGIGAVKQRTEECAERRSAPGEWTWEDAERARLEANTFGRSPFDPKRSPDQVWQSRARLRPKERATFRAEVQRIQAEEERKAEARSQTGEGR
jgi:hypothetical protein